VLGGDLAEHKLASRPSVGENDVEGTALGLHRRVEAVEVSLNGDRTFQLRRLVQGVSDKVLIQQLKDLEADRVIARNDYKEVPPRVDYSLTPLGRSLAEAIVPLCTWGTEMQRSWHASSPSATCCRRCRYKAVAWYQ
jgi:DNA-binding HxlR family transcriptional regulator